MGHLVQYHFYQRIMKLYPVSDDAIENAMRHAQEKFPQESCGVVYSDVYHPMTNSHDQPEIAFRINVNEYKELFLKYGQPDAVIHSHSTGMPHPSLDDMEFQKESGVACGIIVMHRERVFNQPKISNVVFWGGKTKMAPAEGRPFIHGIYDCYATYRDAFFRDFNILIEDFPRDPEWWVKHKKDDLFSDNFAKAGYSEVDMATVKRGDGFLGKYLGNEKINHCAYYFGDGTMLHHLFGTPNSPRLSIRVPVNMFKKYIVKVVRHKSQF